MKGLKTMHTKDKLLTPQEVASHLKIKTGTLDKWRMKKSHPLRPIKIGHLIRYKQSVLDAWLESTIRH